MQAGGGQPAGLPERRESRGERKKRGAGRTAVWAVVMCLPKNLRRGAQSGVAVILVIFMVPPGVGLGWGMRAGRAGAPEWLAAYTRSRGKATSAE